MSVANSSDALIVADQLKAFAAKPGHEGTCIRRSLKDATDVILEMACPEDRVLANDCTASVVKDLSGLAALEEPWNRLFASSPSAAPPLRFDWVRNWWRVFGQDFDRGGGLRVIVFRRDGELIGLLPLYERLVGLPGMRVRQLRFVSTGLQEFEETCTAYLNLLHAPGMGAACIGPLEAALTCSADLRWDELILSDMPEDSPLLQLRKRMGGWGRIVNVSSSGICHVSDLEGGIDQYLERMSAGRRMKSRRAMRELNDNSFCFEIAETVEQAERFFDQLVDLHRARWAANGKSGSFAVRHADFHRSLVIELVAGGQVVLARLSHKGQPIALSYGHRVGGKVDIYQVGVDRKTPVVHSAGSSLFLAMASRLNRDQVVALDHLQGFNQFKQDFAKEQRSLLCLRVMRPRIRFVAITATEVCARAMRKAKRLISHLSSSDSKP